MINITVKKRKGSYLDFLSKGHAGYAEEGQDIVCAAVSALIITTVNSLDAFTEEKICLLYTSPSPRDISGSRMPSSA